uniref:Major facilitator superfamily (MFS) profile domain-containing protein n=1 Tax=Caenorhabditis japonica TaxID=281687 RepID=A0A8R1DYS1_CAEJA
MMSSSISPENQDYEYEKNPDEHENIKHIPFFFLFLCTLCMCSIYANPTVYQSTINFLHEFRNSSESDYHEEIDNQYDPGKQTSRDVVVKYVYYLSNPQKESLITVTSVGTLIAAAPVTYAYNNMGFRRSFVMCAIISIVPALFYPNCVNAKTYLLAIILRILQGFSLAAFIPYVCKLSVFIPFDHIAVPIIVFAYSHISEIFVHPIVSHMAASSLGWHSAHYGAVITIAIIFIIFVVIHFDEDFKERATAIGFCNAMFEYERTRSRTFDLRIPYLSIYQDFRIWVILFTSFVYGCALQLFYQFGPTFFHKVVGHTEIFSAYLTIIAPILNLITSICSVYLYERLANSEQNKMRFFNTIAYGTCGIFLFALGFVDPVNYKYSVTFMFILASSLLGCSYAGHLRMNQIRSGHLHLFLLVNIFIVNSAAMFFSSLLNVLIADNTDYASWSTLFIVTAVFLIIANLIFFFFCSSERAPWAKEGYEDSSIQPYRDEPLPQFPL